MHKSMAAGRAAGTGRRTLKDLLRQSPRQPVLCQRQQSKYLGLETPGPTTPLASPAGSRLVLANKVMLGPLRLATRNVVIFAIQCAISRRATSSAPFSLFLNSVVPYTESPFPRPKRDNIFRAATAVRA